MADTPTKPHAGDETPTPDQVLRQQRQVPARVYEPTAGAPARVDPGKAAAPAVPGGPGSRKERRSLGEILLREKVISPAQYSEAQRAVANRGGTLGGALATLGYMQENQLVSFLSSNYGVPAVNLDEVDIPPEILNLIPKEVAERHKVIPINKQGSSLIVAMSDPSNIYAMDDIKFLTGYNVEVVVAPETTINRAFDRYYDENAGQGTDYQAILESFEEDEVNVVGDEDRVDIDELEKSSKEAPVVRLVNLVLVDAVKRGASDIHIEPYEKDFRIRYRIDGVLYEVMRPPQRLRNAITSRLKIMADLDIAERRLPQDGRIKLVMGKDREVDFRVSVLPTLHGEKVVMRILDKSALQLDLTKLGFLEEQLRHFRNAIHEPWGMVLVTGPTGSGKSTTLYSALMELNKTSENISTAEDPVEITVEGINQVQMQDSIGLNFAAALRSFLRQDPDIIMVGEIRDFETAEIAIKAALTGHMVLSTLHTNDAPSTINRLLNMGIEPFLVTSAVNLILAQRLVRRICPECKTEKAVLPQELTQLGIPESEAAEFKAFVGAGCRACGETGYKGRRAIYEVMPLTDEIKEFVLQGYSAIELKREAVKLGMATLRTSGIAKIREGVTTIDEILRVTRRD